MATPPQGNHRKAVDMWGPGFKKTMVELLRTLGLSTSLSNNFVIYNYFSVKRGLPNNKFEKKLPGE